MKLLKHQHAGVTWRPNQRLTTMAFLGGWGAGKTQGAAVDLLVTCLKNPWTPDYGKQNPLSVISAPTYQILQNATLPAFEKAIEGLAPGIIKQRRGNPNPYILLANGHKILIVSGAAELEGLNLCGFWIDEISHKNYNKRKFSNYQMRLRDPLSNHIRMTVSGLPVYGWVEEAFRPQSATQKTILAGPRDNPFIARETIDAYLSKTASGYEKMLIDGQWIPPEDIVYPQFNATEHLCSTDWAGQDVWIGIDVGNHGAVVCGYKTKVKDRGTMTDGAVVFDQIITSEVSVEGQMMELRRKPYSHKVTVACIDPTVRADELAAVQRVFPNIKIIRRRRGHRFFDIEAGVRVIQRALKDAHGTIRLTFNSRVGNHPDGIVPAFGAYRRKEISQEVKKDNRTDHCMDALRYLVCELLPPMSVAPAVIGRT